MSRFHPLEITDVRRETRDAIVVTLKPREEDREAFRFTQGQYLTFRHRFDDAELRRSYSICAGLDDGALRVGIKRVDGGAFSTWANENLRPGDLIEAMPPMGNFHLPLEPEAAREYLGFAGGSGITPILSIIRTTLAREPKSRFTLVYANRQVGSIMFREELEDLKNEHLGRLSIIHILDSEGQEIDLFSGQIDRAKCDALFCHWIDLPSVDAAFICGPEPMMLVIAEALRAHGVADERIKFELFASSQPGRLPQKPRRNGAADAAATCEASVTLDGVTRTFSFPKQGQSVLEAALAHSLDAPFACTAGVCSTCRAKVLEGEVEMLVNHALEDYEVEQGYVLTCQCYPVSDRIAVSYDQ
ncbi:MAG: phenylacetic acid degradation protein [Hyphomicrobiales bacterium]|nr:MAG: phenylacetic acid degradation protein [Hyphomicrobiales bacterium]